MDSPVTLMVNCTWVCLALAVTAAVLAFSPWGRRNQKRMELLGGWLVGVLAVLFLGLWIGSVAYGMTIALSQTKHHTEQPQRPDDGSAYR